jgi:hypothetical protein
MAWMLLIGGVACSGCSKLAPTGRLEQGAPNLPMKMYIDITNYGKLPTVAETRLTIEYRHKPIRAPELPVSTNRRNLLWPDDGATVRATSLDNLTSEDFNCMKAGKGFVSFEAESTYRAM